LDEVVDATVQSITGAAAITISSIVLFIAGRRRWERKLWALVRLAALGRTKVHYNTSGPSPE
jgi:hypothetical protein